MHVTQCADVLIFLPVSTCNKTKLGHYNIQFAFEMMDYRMGNTCKVQTVVYFKPTVTKATQVTHTPTQPIPSIKDFPCCSDNAKIDTHACMHN